MATKLRGAEEYTIGLDLGTASVGWAVVDSNGELCRFKGKPTWGSRIFESANTAAKTRGHRSQRRRYDRRKRRLWRLQTWVAPDMDKVDSDFFRKMEESFKHADDKNFDDTYDSFLTKEERAKYKTIYHVRHELVNNSEQADIRLVYLALHHILKYRGHFLEDNQKLKASNADSRASVEVLCEALCDWQARRNAGEVTVDFTGEMKKGIAQEIEDKTKRRGERRDNVTNILVDAGLEKDIAKLLSGIVFGYETAFSKILDVEESVDTKFSLSKSDKVDEFVAKYLPAEEEDFFTALTGAYNSYILAGILDGNLGLSGSMVKSYEQHSVELKELKSLVREFLPKEKYNEFFRGDVEETGDYAKKAHDKKKAPSGYTAYVLGVINREEFYKQVTKLFTGVDLGNKQAAWDALCDGIKDETYLLKQRSSDNGAIPHQLHLEEMSAILENQGAYYPTLREHKSDIENLLKFRLPYYAGPLGTEKNPARAERFGWAYRRPGKEHEPIISMESFEEIIDVDKAAEDFIERLTGECSYWYGKKTLPRNSLLYEEFTVRNELNKCRLILEGERDGRPKALSPEVADAIFNDVFREKRRVKEKDVLDYLQQHNHYDAIELIGTQKEKEFASSLAGYHDFKRLLGRDIVTREDRDMVETLIRWATIFEDRKIRTRKIKAEYGAVLSEETIKAVAKKHYTGWGNLSRELLVDLRAPDNNGGYVSIMDILRNSRAERPMNLMEILADRRFGFNELLNEANREYQKDMADLSLDEIPGSPAIKRTIRQAVAVVDEIVSISGHAPRKICVEIAREEEGRGRGERTTSRDKQIANFLNAIKKDSVLSKDAADVKKELSDHKDRLRDKKLYLYFLQLGKCMYTGESLDINRLHEYDIEHIVPRALIKDDSVNNTILVKSKQNRGKSDMYPLPEGLRRHNYGRWSELKRAELLTERKFNALTRSELHDGDLKGFINRQLVETRQITKHVVNVLVGLYGDTAIETVKADLGHNIRERYGLYKSRELNDYHHAHDAFLATQISRFMEIRFPTLAKDLEYSSHSFRADKFRAMLDKQSGSKNPAGLIVWAFGGDEEYVNRETGEIWESKEEVKRIRACLGWKHCFVSRKVEQLTGDFWKMNPISRWASGDKTVPLKTAGCYLDPAKYGGYDKPDSAYYLAVEYDKGKKREKKLVGVPVHISYTLHGKRDIKKWVQDNYPNGKLLRGPIYKYQKIRWDGVEYYLVSPTEIINAGQLCIPRRFHEFVSLENTKYFNGDNKRRFDEDFECLYDFLVERIKKNYPRLSGKLAGKLESEKARLELLKLTEQEKLKTILQILRVLHCDSEAQVTVPIPASGRMENINIFNGKPLQFVYTSVTGMYENEYRV